MEQLVANLNPAQQEAVVNTDGPALIIAGAGAGKTRVLTYRIAYLLSKGVNARTILALTFTNKAAREMKERIAMLVGHDTAKHLWMGTFHSIFANILRREADKLGYPSTYTIYDSLDSKNLVKKIIKDFKLDEKLYKPGDIYGRISWSKNNLITPQAYLSNQQFEMRDRANRQPAIGEIFKTYCIRCYKAGAMDFDDLLLNTNILLRDFPEVLEKYQQYYKYILVDEYQDTNYAQYLIIKKLSHRHQNICVVGDDAQSIYSFRGAKIENILNFRNDYPGYSLYKLEQNYRSTQNIVNAANSLIEKNAEQIKKNVYSRNEIGNKIKIIKALTDNEEGFLVSNAIFDLRQRDHFDYKEFAILYRTNAQSRIFEESLRKKNIPYKVYGGISFYQRKEIKDLLAYLRLLINHNDDEALVRVINYPARGIGDSSVDKIVDTANLQGVSCWQVITNPSKYNIDIQDRILLKIQSFAGMIIELAKEASELEAFEMAYKTATVAGILNDLKDDKSSEGISRFENLEELLNGIKEFSSNFLEENGRPALLTDFLESVALLTDMDTEKPEDNNRVSIMTIHSAKGLEFSNVFVTGMEEDLFPSHLSVVNPKELEEERRLFYVAITRAGKNAFLSFADSRYRWGKLTMCSPSRFLKEIDTKYIENPEILSEIKPQKVSFYHESENNFYKTGTSFASYNLVNQPDYQKKIIKKPSDNLVSSNNLQNFVPDDPDKIQSGMMVEHLRFGKGKVLTLEGSAPNTKATIFFQNAGQKQLLLKYAKLRIIK